MQPFPAEPDETTNAALQRALNSILTAMGCDPASATRAEFKQALWAAASAGACIGCEGEQFEGAICDVCGPGWSSRQSRSSTA